MNSLLQNPESVKGWLEIQAHRARLQAELNDRIKVKPLRGRQPRDIGCFVAEVPREEERPQAGTGSAVRVRGSRRVINRVFAGARS